MPETGMLCHTADPVTLLTNNSETRDYKWLKDQIQFLMEWAEYYKDVVAKNAMVEFSDQFRVAWFTNYPLEVHSLEDSNLIKWRHTKMMKKTVNLGESLQRKYFLAIIESQRHKELHEEYMETIGASTAEEWTQMVVQWEADKSKDNPYVSTVNCNSLSAQSLQWILTRNVDESEHHIKLKLIEAERVEERGSSVNRRRRQRRIIIEASGRDTQRKTLSSPLKHGKRRTRILPQSFTKGSSPRHSHIHLTGPAVISFPNLLRVNRNLASYTCSWGRRWIVCSDMARHRLCHLHVPRKGRRRRNYFLVARPKITEVEVAALGHSPPTLTRPQASVFLGLAMVARGEIALIVAQLARPILTHSGRAKKRTQWLYGQYYCVLSEERCVSAFFCEVDFVRSFVPNVFDGLM
ncbi:Hsp70 ATPase ssc [Salix suchowensis]|nr:Hsp70 ATPase ssc [Salix suchowensis]